jgi:hypothetical protein
MVTNKKRIGIDLIDKVRRGKNRQKAFHACSVWMRATVR